VRLPLPNPALTFTVFMWGFNFVAIKILYVEMSAAALAFSRFLAMWAVLALICLARGESLRYPPEDRWRILGVGFLSMGFYMVLFLEGMRGTTPAEGSIILATTTIFTILLAALAGQERFSGGSLTGSLAAFFGVALVIWAGAASPVHGSLGANLTVLASSVVWAASVVLMRPLLGRLSALRVLTLSMPGALPLLLAYGAGPTLATDFLALSPLAWAMFAQITLLSGVGSFLAFYRGLDQIGPSAATTYQFFVPIVAALFGWAILGQALVPLQAVGVGVVLGGAWYAAKARMRSR
jgi:drug/metabolite transporter (DMT)-like permease